VAKVKFFIPAVAAAMLLAAPAANAGLVGSLTQIVLPTCGTSGQFFKTVDHDSATYYTFPNNGFESGATGWTLSGATVGYGNEPWYVNGRGSHALNLGEGASATSPGFCINLLDPAIRMFAKGSNGGTLNVQVVFRGLTGNITGILNYGTVDGTGSWQATSRIGSLLALPLLTRSAQIKLTVASGTWQVDDALIDPLVNVCG
jgi:hypothetical protein